MYPPKHARSQFQLYFNTLTSEHKKAFAARMGSTVTTIKSNWLVPLDRPLDTHYRDKKPCRNQPKSKLMIRLARASQGKCSYADIVEHFYPITPL